MARTLVIAESPAKAKALSRFLGRDSVVTASEEGVDLEICGRVETAPAGGGRGRTGA